MRHRDRVQKPREDIARRRSAAGLRAQLQRQAHEQRPQPRGPSAQPPQPSPHRRRRHIQRGRDRPMPATRPGHHQRHPDRCRQVHPARHQERRQQRMRHLTHRAATARHPEHRHPRPPPRQPPIRAPPRQRTLAARAALTPKPRAHARSQHPLDQTRLDDYDQQRRKPRGPSPSAKKRGASSPFWRTSSRPGSGHHSLAAPRPHARPRPRARAKSCSKPFGFRTATATTTTSSTAVTHSRPYILKRSGGQQGQGAAAAARHRSPAGQRRGAHPRFF